MICYTAAVYFDFHFSFCLIFLVMFLFGCCQNFGCVLARGWRAPKLNSIILIIILTLKLTPRFGSRLNLIQVSIFYSFMSIGRKLAQQTMQALKFENKRMLPSTVSVFICVDSTRRLCQQIAPKSVLNYSSEIDILMISFSSNRTDRPTPPTTVNRVSFLFLRDRIFTNRF